MFSPEYEKTNTKPDKLYSILPTVLSLLEPIKGKIVLDVGCGSGFFTREISRMGAKHVYGIDISMQSIQTARKRTKKEKMTGVQYMLCDVFEDILPACDIVCFPFVLNLAKNIQDVLDSLKNCFSSLHHNGKIVLVIDIPMKNKSRERIQKQKGFGTVKTLLDEGKDGTLIQIELYNDEKKIYSFQSRFFTPTTIEKCLHDTGFKNVQWHTPIISLTGIQKMPNSFWKGYQQICELGYITAEKLHP